MACPVDIEEAEQKANEDVIAQREEALAKKLGDTGLPGRNDVAFISHGDCIEDAQYLEKLLKEKYGVKEVFTYYVGAVIGSHAGPGVLALFFIGDKR